jgi:hypothetical protein
MRRCSFSYDTVLENARTVLQSRQIRFQEVTETSPMQILDEPGRSMTAAGGTRR